MHGLMILAPMGSGKSTLVQRTEDSRLKDGDEILRQEGVVNGSYIWYTPGHGDKGLIIEQCLRRHVLAGEWVLYSGNPVVMNYDILVVPDRELRWKRLQQRKKEGGFCPPYNRFQIEEGCYRRAIKKAKYVFESMPSLEELARIQQELYP